MRRSAAAAVGFAVALAAARAGAHEVGLSRGEYVVEGSTARVDLAFARRELSGLVATLDANGDGALTSAEVEAARGAIEGALVNRVKVKGDGVACPGSLERAELTDQDGIAVRAIYRCSKRPRAVAIDLTFLDDLAFGHRHLARASTGAGPVAIDHVLSQRSRSLTIDVPEGPAPAPREEGGAFAHGARRVLLRHEAPAFLLALLASRVGARGMAIAAACFTAAVALGLWLGARALFLPSPAAVAAAIAISLVYVGVVAPRARSGALLALPFGVVHGLGCAHAFRAPEPLGIFTLGVGAGLFVIAAALLLVALWAQRRAMNQARLATVTGGIVAAAGLYGLLMGRT
jgi:hypothetical protein